MPAKMTREEWIADRKQSLAEFREEYRAAGGDGEKWILATKMAMTGLVLGELERASLIEVYRGKYRPRKGARIR